MTRSWSLTVAAMAAGVAILVATARANGTAAGVANPLSQAALSDGLVDTTFAPAIPNGSVDAILPLADGSVIIGGDFDFTRSDGTVQHGLAKLTPTGAFDPTFAPGAGVSVASGTAAVTTLALQPDGRILVGGNFTQIGGVAESHLARVDATGSVDATFSAVGVTNAPTQIAMVSDGRIVVAQDTSTLTWLSPGGLVAQTSVPVHIWTQQDSFFIQKFDTAADGSITAAGHDNSANWANTDVVRFHSDGSLDAVLGKGLTYGATAYAVYAFADRSVEAVFNGAPWTGSEIPPPPRLSIFRWDPTNTAATADTTIRSGGHNAAYIQPDGRVVAAAQPWAGAASTLGRYFPNGNRDLSFIVGQGVAGTVDAVVAAADGGVYVGGDFSAIDNYPQPKLAKLHATNVNATAPALVNVSARAFVDGGDRVLIAGFVTDGSKSVILRAVGPTLAQYGISDPLLDPQFTAYDANQTVIGYNDDWGENPGDTTALQIGFTLPQGSKDAALQISVAPGIHTMVVNGVGGASGVGLAEVYQDPAATNSRLINLSARAYVAIGEQVLIAGFIVHGGGTGHFLIRGLGPTLAKFGVSAPLARPLLTVYDGQHHVIATNADWTTAPDPALLSLVAAEVGAIPLQNYLRDSAVLLELPDGTYSATISGADGGTGVATAELYVVP